MGLRDTRQDHPNVPADANRDILSARLVRSIFSVFPTYFVSNRPFASRSTGCAHHISTFPHCLSSGFSSSTRPMRLPRWGSSWNLQSRYCKRATMYASPGCPRTLLIRAHPDRIQTKARLGAGGVRPTRFAVKSDLRLLQRAVLKTAKTLGSAPRHFNMLFWTLFAVYAATWQWNVSLYLWMAISPTFLPETRALFRI